MRVLIGLPPDGIGQRLQWECNKRRMLLGLPPYPGPRPRWAVVKKKKPRRVIVRRQQR